MENKKIESELRDLLYDALSSINQESGIRDISYNPKEKTCTVVLSVVNIPEDDYIGFAGY